MRKILITVAVLALALAACAQPDGSIDDTTTTSTATSTTAATEPETTTSVASESTTTTVASTTDTSDVAGFLASLQDTSATSSGRIEGAIVFTGLESGGETIDEAAMYFSSAFDAASGDGAFTMDMSSFAESIPSDPDDPFADLASSFLGSWEVRQIGDRAYMKMGFFNFFLGVETEWISMPAEDGAGFSQDFQTVPSDPNDVFDAYEGANATIENLGVEAVNGVQATHYRIAFDLEGLAEELTSEERAELEASGVFTDGVLPIDIWVDDRGYTVRMYMEIDGATVDSPTGEGFGSMTMTWDVLDIGQPVSIDPPPAADVTAVEDLEGWGDFGSFDFGTDV